MKTLKKHEEEFWENYNQELEKAWRKVGVVCDRCGAELEENTTTILTSNPSQRQLRCPKCKWVGSGHF